ncbi:hypothetical protein JXA85_02110 [Candidatus Woesearchaeota archaeon]|nr:hypothetical protein [Candidatus Woesearchaeota archaeon]
MPHQCVKCSKMYDDASEAILKGCDNCGGRLFFFIKKEKLEAAKKITVNLTQDEKQQIENDVLELVGEDKKDEPVVLDFESIRVMQPGKYELDLVNLFRKRPLVYKLEEGKYVIDLAESFQAERKRNNSSKPSSRN